MSLHLEIKEGLRQKTGLGRIGKTEEIAAMVAFLVSDEANYIIGQNYAVCGLMNLGDLAPIRR